MTSTPTLEEAYKLHHKRVWKLCFSMSHNHDDADDLTQDVFLHLGKKLHQFRGDSQFTTWLHRVTVNFVLMKLRSAAIHRKYMGGVTLSLEEMAENPEGMATLQRALACRDAQLESSIDRDALQKALAKLAGSYRLCVSLHHLQGYSTEEVAEMLGISVGAVKSYCFRGVDRMAVTLGATQPEAEVDELLKDFSKYL